MPFNEPLAARVRELVSASNGVVERRMFGGLTFLVHGYMSVGIHGTDLIVRIEPRQTERALSKPGAPAWCAAGAGCYTA